MMIQTPVDGSFVRFFGLRPQNDIMQELGRSRDKVYNSGNEQKIGCIK